MNDLLREALNSMVVFGQRIIYSAKLILDKMKEHDQNNRSRKTHNYQVLSLGKEIRFCFT